MSSIDAAAQPTGSLTGGGRHVLDLTGPRSHTLQREAGVGSVVIGPQALCPKADLHVESDATIDWAAFAPFATPAGSPWPRVIRYTGGDVGVLAWAGERAIEQLSWELVSAQDITLDASASIIHTLALQLPRTGGKVHLALPRHATSERTALCISGDLGRFSASGDPPLSLSLAPATGKASAPEPYRLPDPGILRAVTDLALVNKPLAQPISLTCLCHFDALRTLSLYGSFVDLEVLAAVPGLEDLQLRFMPDLSGLPALSSWPALEGFIAFNIDEVAGKRLRQQLKARAAIRPWAGHAAVTQLRSPAWWQREFGRPFSAWPRRLATPANAAYDVALAALAAAPSLDAAEKAIREFSAAFNRIKGIETAERDDLGEAVWQLGQGAQAQRLGVSEALAQQWFDAARDY